MLSAFRLYRYACAVPQQALLRELADATRAISTSSSLQAAHPSSSRLPQVGRKPLPPDATYPRALESIRHRNNMLPYLKGQVVKGRVMAVDRDTVVVDVGFKTESRFYKSELSLSQVVETSPESASALSPKTDFEPGDVLHFVVEEVETPYGDMQLNAQRPGEEQRQSQVWQELIAKHERGEMVQGRVLNEVNGGFAVGVAGFVTFCPFSMCSPLTARKIGVLQQFYISNVTESNEGRRNIIVVDAKLHRARPGARFDPSSRVRGAGPAPSVNWAPGKKAAR